MKAARAAAARVSSFFLDVPIYFKILGIGIIVAMIFGTVMLYEVQRSLTAFFYVDLRSRIMSTGHTLSEILIRPVALDDVVDLYQTLQEETEGVPDIDYIFVLGPDNTVLAHTFKDKVPASLLAPQTRDKDRVAIVHEEDHLVFDLEVPILKGSADRLRIGFSDVRIRRELDSITKSFLAALIVCLLLGQILAILLTTILVEPITDLTAISRAVRSGDYSGRARVHSSDEIGQLAVTFNQMMESLEQQRTEITGRETERRTFIDRLVTMQEEERRSIARELHDHVGPSLSALLLLSETLKREGVAAGTVSEFETRLRSSLDEMRQMAFMLRPAILDDYGLDSALRQYVGFLREHANGVRIEYRYAGEANVERLPLPVETALYRIGQEALTNALRHARAKSISVIVFHRTVEAAMMVEDDGIGIDANVVRTGALRGTGMISMRERAEFLGGALVVESEREEKSARSGTLLRVTIPIRGQAA